MLPCPLSRLNAFTGPTLYHCSVSRLACRYTVTMANLNYSTTTTWYTYAAMTILAGLRFAMLTGPSVNTTATPFFGCMHPSSYLNLSLTGSGYVRDDHPQNSMRLRGGAPDEEDHAPAEAGQGSWRHPSEHSEELHPDLDLFRSYGYLYHYKRSWYDPLRAPTSDAREDAPRAGGDAIWPFGRTWDQREGWLARENLGRGSSATLTPKQHYFAGPASQWSGAVNPSLTPGPPILDPRIPFENPAAEQKMYAWVHGFSHQYYSKLLPVVQDRLHRIAHPSLINSNHDWQYNELNAYSNVPEHAMLSSTCAPSATFFRNTDYTHWGHAEAHLTPMPHCQPPDFALAGPQEQSLLQYAYRAAAARYLRLLEQEIKHRIDLLHDAADYISLRLNTGTEYDSGLASGQSAPPSPPVSAASSLQSIADELQATSLADVLLNPDIMQIFCGHLFEQWAHANGGKYTNELSWHERPRLVGVDMAEPPYNGVDTWLETCGPDAPYVFRDPPFISRPWGAPTGPYLRDPRAALHLVNKEFHAVAAPSNRALIIDTITRIVQGGIRSWSSDEVFLSLRPRTCQIDREEQAQCERFRTAISEVEQATMAGNGLLVLGAAMRIMRNENEDLTDDVAAAVDRKHLARNAAAVLEVLLSPVELRELCPKRPRRLPPTRAADVDISEVFHSTHGMRYSVFYHPDLPFNSPILPPDERRVYFNRPLLPLPPLRIGKLLIVHLGIFDLCPFVVDDHYAFHFKRAFLERRARRQHPGIRTDLLDNTHLKAIVDSCMAFPTASGGQTTPQDGGSGNGESAVQATSQSGLGTL